MTDFSEYKKIDMHSHCGTYGDPFYVTVDSEYLLKQMDEYNIEKSLICASGSEKNEETKKVCSRDLNRLIPIARIDCTKGKEAYDTLEHYLSVEGFRGAKLQSLFDGYAVDSGIVDPVAEICKQYKVPLFVHSGHEPFSLPWQIGLLAERHPDLRICMLHMGHGHKIYVDAAIEMATRYKNIWLEMSGTSMSAMIQKAYRVAGSDKVMFGIDTPFHAPSVEIQKVRACDIGDEGYKRIFYDNAVSFLNN